MEPSLREGGSGFSGSLVYRLSLGQFSVYSTINLYRLMRILLIIVITLASASFLFGQTLSKNEQQILKLVDENLDEEETQGRKCSKGNAAKEMQEAQFSPRRRRDTE